MPDSKRCTKCGDTKPASEFGRDSKARDGLFYWCRDCCRAYREANRVRDREYQRQRSRTHREEALERNRRWREANRERFNEQARQYQAQPEVQEQRRQYRTAIRERVLARYGNACACCGATADLGIDHVHGDGGVHRQEFGPHNVGSYRFYLWLIRENFPPGFQVLCLRCNQSKGKGERCRLWHGDPAFKRCTDCDQVKPLEDFHRNATASSGRAGYCKACMSARCRDIYRRTH